MKAANELRTRLREATAQIHERLHGHPGLGAAASGAIGRDDYRSLLARLWGFHKAFETALDEAARVMQTEVESVHRSYRHEIVPYIPPPGAELVIRRRRMR